MPGGRAIFWFHRVHRADGVLLRLCCLTLSGLLLSVLLRQVSADHAATDRTNDRMVSSIVTGHTANDRAFEAASSVCRSDCCQGQRRCNQGYFYRASFHSKVL
jgi:hypothetical protein